MSLKRGDRGVKAVPMTGRRDGDFTDNSNRCHTFDEFCSRCIFRSCVWPLYPLQVFAKRARFSGVSDVAKSESVVRWLKCAATREKHVAPHPVQWQLCDTWLLNK